MARYHRAAAKTDKLEEKDAKKRGCPIPKQFKLNFKDKKLEVDIMPKDLL